MRKLIYFWLELEVAVIVKKFKSKSQARDITNSCEALKQFSNLSCLFLIIISSVHRQNYSSFVSSFHYSFILAFKRKIVRLSSSFKYATQFRSQLSLIRSMK